MISLGKAAKLAGVGKSTIAKAITSGRMSATRNPDGSYAIDPAELARVFPISLDGHAILKNPDLWCSKLQ